MECKIHRKKVSVNGINIFYRDTETDRQPMLCLHGRWGRGETWSDFLFRYHDRYRIIAPDQRGHGLSDKPVSRYAGEDLAEDAYQLIKILNCEPVIVVGHSMGGRIAAYLTARYPESVKALIILDETAEGPEKMSDIASEDIGDDDNLTAFWPTPYPTYEHALRDLKGRFGRDTNVRYFLESLTETIDGYDFLFSRYAMTAIGAYSQNWYQLLPEIECPVLLVRAAESWCLSKEDADKMKLLIKNCTYFEVSESDHMVYADNLNEFYPRFEQFLSKVLL